MKATYLVPLYGLDPLESVFRIFSSEVPNAVVDTYVETALVKFMRLQDRERERERERGGKERRETEREIHNSITETAAYTGNSFQSSRF